MWKERLLRCASKMVKSALWRRALGRLMMGIRVGKIVNVLRLLVGSRLTLRGSLQRGKSRKGRRAPKFRRWKPPLRGKSGLNPQEQTEYSGFRFNLYFRVLRLPWPLFLMSMAGTYFLTSLIFAFLYYLDLDGLHVEQQTRWPSWILRFVPTEDKSMLTVLMYSCAISTNLSQIFVDAHSLYTLSLGNFHALVIQLISAFWCSALCERISQPIKVVRWSNVGVISCKKQLHTSSGTNLLAKYRVLTFRFDLLGAYTTGIVDAKFDIMCYNGSLNSQFLPRELSLVHKQFSSITRGVLLQHVVNESSPIYDQDLAAMKDGDYMFRVSVRAIEKTTMRQVFNEHHYSVHDGDILWDCEFEDQMSTDENGNSVYDYTLLNSVRSPHTTSQSWTTKRSTARNSQETTMSPRENLKIWKALLWLAFFFSFMGRSTPRFESTSQVWSSQS